MPRYTHAIVSRIPNSVQLDGKGGKQQQKVQIDLTKARKEQEELCDALRESGVDVIELAPEDAAPSSTIHIEDLAIVCNGTALVTRPPRPSRRQEVSAILSNLGFHVIEIEALESQNGNKNKILLEGSDVLFTGSPGREFFVGLTNQTNVAGAIQLARAFPEYPVVPIKVSTGHCLKSYVSLAAPNVIAVGSSKEAKNVLKRIEREATYRYSTITIGGTKDETTAAAAGAVNSLSINRSLIYRAEWPDTYQKLLPLTPNVLLCGYEMRELSKLGGLLSQHVILLRRIRLLKRI